MARQHTTSLVVSSDGGNVVAASALELGGGGIARTQVRPTAHRTARRVPVVPRQFVPLP